MSNKRSISILMLGGARRVSLGELLIADASKFGYELKIYSYELTAEVPIATVGEVIIGKKWKDSDVVDHIVEVVNRFDIDIILPFVDGAIAIAAECKARLPKVFIPVSPTNVATAMYDKAEAAKLFKEKSFPIPTDYPPTECQFPVIAKPRFGSASKGIVVLENKSELAKLTTPEDYLLQEYIAKSEEYTVDCYVSQKGEALYVIPRLRIDVVGGEVAQTRTCRIEELISLSKDVIESIPFRGPITIQFLHDLTTGRYLLMEINPRLGGGVVCSVHAGAPLAEYLIHEATGQPVSKCDEWKNDLFITRYFKEVVFHGK